MIDRHQPPGNQYPAHQPPHPPTAAYPQAHPRPSPYAQPQPARQPPFVPVRPLRSLVGAEGDPYGDT
ncbi:hypothetical protein FM076_01445 [Streptomyces albus subsp. chlorinus]|uniref:hypothetical protein n=1 Tax=Streptomyces albus TaxID=1888 RepID=UPI001D364A83|nr:hypothetical protein [Streptomyces albus subsp. chlorinus]